jgi:hypothetical protein
MNKDMSMDAYNTIYVSTSRVTINSREAKNEEVFFY